MSKPSPVAQRREHIIALCEEHDVTCEFQPQGVPKGLAWTSERRVLIPQTTMVRSYYIGLHEIAHCVLGYDHDLPATPQEAAVWRWAIAEAIEPPTMGLKRMMFKALWHYLLRDMGVRDADQLTNRDLFPGPDDPFRRFLASLDDGGRLLYEAARVTARTGPPLAWQQQAYQELDEERRRGEEAVERAKEAGRRALVREQLRVYGPPTPAKAGERVLIGTGEKAHIWCLDGKYGTVVKEWLIYCGARGVAHRGPEGASGCLSCERLQASGNGPFLPGSTDPATTARS